MSSLARLVFLCLPLLLSGCSIFSFGYNHADTYLRYTIHDYTSFDAAQKAQIKQDVEAYLQWHRKTMLPAYIDFLHAVKRSTQSNITLKPAEVTRLRQHVQALYIETLEPALNPTAHLLVSLSPKQIDALKHSFAENIAKQRKKDLAGSFDERLQLRTERTLAYLQDFVGDFSDTQLVNLRGMNHSLPYATEVYLRNRELQQARLVTLLNEHASEAQVADFLLQWVAHPEAHRSQQDQQLIEAFEQASDVFIAEAYGMLDETQRLRFQKTLDRYISIFQKLHNTE